MALRKIGNEDINSYSMYIYGYHVPGPTRLGKMWKPLLSTDTRGTRETREIVTSRTSQRTLLLHMPLTDLLRRIYRLADSRSGTLESTAGRFFDPRVEGVRQLLPLRSLFFICPCRSLLSTDYCLSPCCHTLRRCSSIVRTLCLRRENWGHYPPPVSTRKSYWRLTAVDCINRIQLRSQRCRPHSTSTHRQEKRSRLVQLGYPKQKEAARSLHPPSTRPRPSCPSGTVWLRS